MLIASSRTQGWEASALGDLQRGSLCADGKTAAFSLLSLNSVPSRSPRAGALHTLAGARHETCLERCSVGPAAAAMPYICDRFLSGCHNCFGAWMKQQLPKAAGSSGAVLCISPRADLTREESIWRVWRESFVSSFRRCVWVFQRWRDLPSIKTLRIKLLSTKVNEVPEVWNIKKVKLNVLIVWQCIVYPCTQRSRQRLRPAKEFMLVTAVQSVARTIVTL